MLEDVRRYPMQWAMAIGLMSGLVVTALVSKAIDRFGRWPDEISPEVVGAWSYVGGGLAGLTAFGLVFPYLRGRVQLHPVRSDRSLQISRALLLIGAPVVGAVGLVFLWWNMALGPAPLTSLEGAWLWPAGILPLFVAYLMFRRAGRIQGFLDSGRN